MSFTRRMLIVTACLIVGLGVAGLRALAHNRSDSPRHAQPTAAEALALLKEGNSRFVAGKLRYPHTGKEWLQGLTKAKLLSLPFWDAAILACHLNYCSIRGSETCLLFALLAMSWTAMLRVASSTAWITVARGWLWSWATRGVAQVTAALGSADDISHEPNEIQRLVKQIKPVDRVIKQQLPFEEALQRSVEANVRASVRSLSQVPDLARAIEQKQVMIVGCVYDIATGTVRFLDS